MRTSWAYTTHRVGQCGWRLQTLSRNNVKTLILFVFFLYKEATFTKFDIASKFLSTSSQVHFDQLFFSASRSLSNLDRSPSAQALYLFPNNRSHSLSFSFKMPSTFLSLLLAALTIERATAVPTPSSLSLASRSQGNSSFPQWAIDACNNSLGCKVVNGAPTYQKPALKTPVSHLAVATNSSGIQSGVDDNKNDYFNVQLDDQYVGTGLCAPDEFLKILFERSECPIGSTSMECGASKYSSGWLVRQERNWERDLLTLTEPFSSWSFLCYPFL